MTRTRSLLPIDQLNLITNEIQDKITESNSKETELDAEWLEDTVLDLLIMAYAFGCDSANEDLETEISPDTDQMQKSIYKKIEGKTFTERLSEYGKAKDFESIKRVCETETHRVYNDSQYDVAKEVEKQINTPSGKSESKADSKADSKSDSNEKQSKDSFKIKKTWVTMMDDKVRDTHEVLQNVTIDLDERFYTIDGDSALRPGDFENPENDINCRCELRLSKVKVKGNKQENE